MRKTSMQFLLLVLASALLITGCTPTAGFTPSAQPSAVAADASAPATEQTAEPMPSPTPSPTPEPRVYRGTTVLVMGSADGEFSRDDIHPFTYLLLFIDAVNGQLTVVSLPFDLAMDAKDADGQDTGRAPLQDVYSGVGMAGVVKTLEARLDITIDNAIIVNGDLTMKLLAAVGPVSVNVAADILQDGAFEMALENFGYVLSSKINATVPAAEGEQMLDALQLMAAAVSVPQSVYEGDYSNAVIPEENRYRQNRELIVKALAPVIRNLDPAAMAKVFADNEGLYAADIAVDGFITLIQDLQKSFAGDPALLQLPLGDMTMTKSGNSILIEGGPVETEREELQKLLIR